MDKDVPEKLVFHFLIRNRIDVLLMSNFQTISETLLKQMRENKSYIKLNNWTDSFHKMVKWFDLWKLVSWFQMQRE